MPMRIFSKICLALYVFFGAGTANLLAREYAWPLKLKPDFSSRFGDVRSGHWHAGIDLRTQGRTGFEVYAIADGHVAKVRTSYWGYGKSLYLQMADGNMAVYGHLERFAPEIDRYVYNRQLNQRSYFQEIYFPSDRFPVNKGDIVAYSGQTGVGYPHLHLEIRNKDNIPLNPLIGYYKVADTQAPVARLLGVKNYLEFGGQNNHDTEIISLSGQSPTYDVKDTIAIYGQTVMAVAAYDLGVGFDYSIYRGLVLLDGEEIFSFVHDSLNYATGHQIAYVNDGELTSILYGSRTANEDKQAFYRLYCLPNDHQAFYNGKKFPSGILSGDDLDAKPHRLVITLYDVAGNFCRIKAIIKKATLENPRFSDLTLIGKTYQLDRSGNHAYGKFQVQWRNSRKSPFQGVSCDFDPRRNNARFAMQGAAKEYRIRARNADGEFSPWITFEPFPRASSAEPFTDYLAVVFRGDERLYVNGTIANQEIADLFPLGNDYWQGLIPISIKQGTIELITDRGDTLVNLTVCRDGLTIYSPDSLLALDISRKNLYEPSLIQLTPIKPDISNVLSFSVIPDNLLFNGRVNMKIYGQKLGIDMAKTAVYSVSGGKNSFKTRLTAKTAENWVAAGGKYSLLADNRPPVITAVKPLTGASLRNNKPLISCRISDALSGLGKEEQFEMTIDGNWVPAEYDITTGVYSYKVKTALKPGAHAVRIRVADNQGNIALATTSFRILGKL